MPEAETAALNLTCVECGRDARPGELWRLYFVDIGEVAVYCSACAEREFGDSRGGRHEWN